MRFCIFMGSPREVSNTAELLKPFMQTLMEEGHTVSYHALAGMDIRPCQGCYACQHVEGAYGCVIQDDVPALMEDIRQSDCIVFATPIYTWYCTAPMKALLDRHYGLNKFYGRATGSLWAGKRVALVVTQGYDTGYGAGPFETGMQHLCEHSKLRYMGMFSVRDLDDLASFQTEEATQGAKAFARAIAMP